MPFPIAQALSWLGLLSASLPTLCFTLARLSLGHQIANWWTACLVTSYPPSPHNPPFLVCPNTTLCLTPTSAYTTPFVNFLPEQIFSLLFLTKVVFKVTCGIKSDGSFSVLALSEDHLKIEKHLKNPGLVISRTPHVTGFLLPFWPFLGAFFFLSP